MRKLFLLLSVLAFTVTLSAQEGVYTVGIDAYKTNKNSAYVDVNGNPITGTVVNSETKGNNISETRSVVVNGYEEGRSTIYLNGRKTVEIEQSKGKAHGNMTHFYPSGAVRSVAPYVDGKIDGIVTGYNEDGTVMEQNWIRGTVVMAGYDYTNDKAVPVAKMQESICNQADKTDSEKEYTLNKDAFFDNHTQLYVDKQKKAITGRVLNKTAKQLSEMDVTNGMLNGVVRVYTNGVLIKETYYKDNDRHGTDIIFYPNGKAELSVQYAHDVIDGLITAWRDSGNIEHEVIFRKGKVMSGYLYNGSTSVIMTKEDIKEMESIYLAIP